MLQVAVHSARVASVAAPLPHPLWTQRRGHITSCWMAASTHREIRGDFRCLLRDNEWMRGAAGGGDKTEEGRWGLRSV